MSGSSWRPSPSTFVAVTMGLAATVQRELGLDPHSGVIVVFRAKRADRIKILVSDGSGLVMIYKRLEGRQLCLAGYP